MNRVAGFPTIRGEIELRAALKQRTELKLGLSYDNPASDSSKYVIVNPYTPRMQPERMFGWLASKSAARET